MGRNFGKPNGTTVAAWEMGCYVDQGLEWAGLGPEFLFLVIGDAAETSAVECILEGFIWAQHCPFTWHMLMLFVPGFCPASPVLQGRGMRAVSIKPAEELPSTTSKCQSFHLSLEGPENNGSLRKMDGTCFPEAPRPIKARKQTGKPFPRSKGPSLPCLLHQPGAALGLIKRRLLVGQCPAGHSSSDT